MKEKDIIKRFEDIERGIVLLYDYLRIIEDKIETIRDFLIKIK